MAEKIRVTVWNEFRHEKTDEAVKQHYPNGIHAAIAGFLNKEKDIQAAGATLDEKEHGLTDSILAATDVLIWWAHLAHGEVQDEIANKVVKKVQEGMGLIALHSAHFSKPLTRLLGSTCVLKWREAGEKERLWNIEPGHPITQGIPDYIELPHEEMYGERFDIPTPDSLVFISWFPGGEVFRSGATWQRGHGKIFYFRPGHETFPTYHDANIQKIITNAVRWAKPGIRQKLECPNVKPLEKL
jgi:trehalose utilization protein